MQSGSRFAVGDVRADVRELTDFYVSDSSCLSVMSFEMRLPAHRDGIGVGIDAFIRSLNSRP